MTEQSNAELIAKLKRAHRMGVYDPDDPRCHSLWGDAADALEAAEKRTEEAEMRAFNAETGESIDRGRAAEFAAVVEKVRAICDKALAVRVVESSTSQAQDAGIAAVILRDILSSAPADALRDHDAALIEGLADEVLAVLTDPERSRPRDPKGEFATDLLNDVEWAVHLIREKARQKREEQS